MQIQKFALTMMAALILAACNGGGSSVRVASTETPETPTTPTTPTTPEQPSALDALSSAEVPANASVNTIADEADRSAVQAEKQFSFKDVFTDDETGAAPDSIEINGQTLAEGGNAAQSFANLPEGKTELSFKASKEGESLEGKLYVYNQPYSMLIGEKVESGDDDLRHFVDDNSIRGLNTTGDQFQAFTTGISNGTTFEYKGEAFNGSNDVGELSYNVVFSEHGTKGSGSITGLTETGTITLNESNVDVDGKGHVFVNGGATAEAHPDILPFPNDLGQNGSGTYTLYFFGPKADEIAGKASFGDDSGLNEVGFAGKFNKEISPAGN